MVALCSVAVDIGQGPPGVGFGDYSSGWRRWLYPRLAPARGEGCGAVMALRGRGVDVGSIGKQAWIHRRGAELTEKPRIFGASRSLTSRHLAKRINSLLCELRASTVNSCLLASPPSGP